jgi:hypothetical protein
MKEWNEFDPREIVRKYRQIVYETGAVDAGKGKTMDKKIVARARRKGYRISRTDRFRCRCRYFTDSGVIGGKTLFRRYLTGSNTCWAPRMNRNLLRLAGLMVFHGEAESWLKTISGLARPFRMHLQQNGCIY